MSITTLARFLFRRNTYANLPTLLSAGEGYLATDTKQFLIGDGTKNLLAAQMLGRLSKSVAGAVDVTLTAKECSNGILEFTGLLTGNINVIVGLQDGQFWTVYNSTTGAFTLTVKTPSGTGVAITQTKRCGIYCDAANIVKSSAEV